MEKYRLIAFSNDWMIDSTLYDKLNYTRILIASYFYWKTDPQMMSPLTTFHFFFSSYKTNSTVTDDKRHKYLVRACCSSCTTFFVFTTFCLLWSFTEKMHGNTRSLICTPSQEQRTIKNWGPLHTRSIVKTLQVLFLHSFIIIIQ